jgi:predicted regulator of Ras-like GTPase activity (Roadblock/LC7/MglB family)
MTNAGYGAPPAQQPQQPPQPPQPQQPQQTMQQAPSMPSQMPPAGVAPQISPVQSAGPGAASSPQKPANAGLFSIDDSVIDKIFSDNLGVSEGQSKSGAAAEPIAPPQKIEGVGRLDSRVDHNQDAGSGRISSIGKFLLDQKDMEKLGKLSAADLSDSSMRILTQEAAGELTTLLHHIAAQNAAVVGSVIVGHDGLLIANTMPPEIEAESVGVWALGVYMNTAHVVKKMGQNRVHQIVSKTPKGYLVIADFGGGLLVVVSDGKDTDTLIPLMRSITQLVVQ